MFLKSLKIFYLNNLDFFIKRKKGILLRPVNHDSSFKYRVAVSRQLMFLESYGNCDVTNTVTLILWRHKTISNKHRNSPVVNI